MDAALSIFDELKRKQVALLDEWIKEGYREDLHLDFKRKAHHHLDFPDDNDKRNFSRALSGFGNSDGGLIVWGINAPGSGVGLRDKKPIRGVSKFAEHLDSLASRLVSPPVQGAENLVLLEKGGKGEGYVISFIPASIRSPHRAEHHALKKYYQRSGDSFLELEHWQLEYMFGRRQVPDLRVAWDVIPLREEEMKLYPEGLLSLADGQGDRALLRIGMLNKGRAISRYPCLRIHFRQKHDTFVYNPKYKHALIHYSDPEPTYFKPGYVEITARANPGLVVYPNDRMAFFEFRFTYDKEKLRENGISDFTFYYDLFGEKFRGENGQKMTIPGETLVRILEE